jgi:hypothetical protein
MTRRTYNLYVDESGSFARPGEASVVCGVLEDTSAGIDWEAARRELQRALPFFDHPQHAALLNTSSAWLAAVLRNAEVSPSAPPREQELRRICGWAAGLIHAVPIGQAPELDEFRRHLAEGRIPPFRVLTRVDAWLHGRHRACFLELSSRADQYRLHLQDTLRRLFHGCRHGQLVGLAALARPQGDRKNDAFSSATPNAVRLDSYVLALETLLERVVCLLRGTNDCRVDLWVATRDVELRGFGSVDLSRDALQQIAARAQTFP